MEDNTYTQVIGHEEVKLMSTQGLHPYVLACLVQEVILQATKREM